MRFTLSNHYFVLLLRNATVIIRTAGQIITIYYAVIVIYRLKTIDVSAVCAVASHTHVYHVNNMMAQDVP